MGKKLGEVKKSPTRWEHVDDMQTRIAAKQVGRWILGVNVGVRGVITGNTVDEDLERLIGEGG